MLSKDTMYGSDRNGLIWGYRFTPGQAAESISAEAAIQLLSSTEALARHEFVWLHFSRSNTATETWLMEHLELPEAFFEAMHEESRSTRLEQEDDFLIAVLNDVLFAFSFDVSAVETTSICITPNLMVTTRLRPLRSIDRLRRLVRRGQQFSSPVELLARLLQNQSSVLVEILRQSTSRVDQIEDRLLANRITTSRSELSSLRRVLVKLQRLLAPEPSAFFRLLNRPPEWITKDDLQDLRESAEEIAAAVSDTQALVERVKLIQEELVALLNEQTGRTIYILTVVTVLALPINMVAGLFGMNVGGIPLASDRLGFWSIVIILLALTVILAYLAFGKRRD
ncbi:transporter [Desulfobulbus rhabdoformis]|uniref:transporter n=1 Tax=Desulfobulbus rhabdoformis TaxID=34032 RepID=UPI0019660145|nr:transporter [Desulfobulbus rhabdoformis]MBM9612675.1 transporter [Desulfobulbus rhabdoformis]